MQVDKMVIEMGGEKVEMVRDPLTGIWAAFSLGEPVDGFTTEECLIFDQILKAGYDKAMQEVGEKIHYPKCWDIFRYPTLSDAVDYLFDRHRAEFGD